MNFITVISVCVCNGRESELASWRRRSRSLTATSAPSVRDAVNVGSRQSRVTEEEEEEEVDCHQS